MRILIFEYVTGGGLADEPVPESLAREGGLMLDALLRDLSDLEKVRTVAFRDGRLGLPEGPGAHEWIVIGNRADLERSLTRQIRRCDAVWPIAPEMDGQLEDLCRRVEAAGRPLLNSASGAVRMAGSKRNTALSLEAAGVPVVATVPLADRPPDLSWPLVIKPDDGTGCEGARLVETPEDWREIVATVDHRRPHVVQPLVEGEALSLSAVFAQRQARLLSINRQKVIREAGGFRLRGCTVNAEADPEGLFCALATRIAQALPGLWGYAGIDLIRSRDGLRVLEINPRLTTSYCGLHKALGLNPAALVLALLRDGHLPHLNPGPGRVVEIDLEPCPLN